MNINITDHAWDSLYTVVDNALFQSQDAELIYSSLKENQTQFPFGIYLRRYLFKKYELPHPFDSVSLSVYQELIVKSFRVNQTPPTFQAGKSSSKISTLAGNWLRQQTVNRKVVLLLGFGLDMTLEEVNLFLTKVLREQGLNAKNPFEIVCWYCFRSHYPYSRFSELWQKYLDEASDHENKDSQYREVYTETIWQSLSAIQDDDSLLEYLRGMNVLNSGKTFSYTARKEFDRLYLEARILVAKLYNQTESGTKRIKIREYENTLLQNDRFSDAERMRRVNRKKGQIKVYTEDDISAADLEHVICSSIPIDSHGNLKTSKASSLHLQFQGKRFSRQHITDILTNREEVNRFDLITLNFLLYSQSMDLYPNAMRRFNAFIASTNEILVRCNMSALYVANPYESFVLMCILAEDPLGTYSDVWEKAYSVQN